MDAGLLWTALGTLATLAGVAVAWRQMALQARQTSASPAGSRLDVHGVSVLPPTGRLPPTIRGRDPVLRELLRRLRRPGGELVVLGGMGGAGKTTVSLTLAEQARDMRVGWRGVDVWWVSGPVSRPTIGGRSVVPTNRPPMVGLQADLRGQVAV